jgi:hypothetical protein
MSLTQEQAGMARSFVMRRFCQWRKTLILHLDAQEKDVA